MSFAVATSLTQFWAFLALSVIFFVCLIRAFSRRASETGARSDTRSRTGIIIQSIGIGLAGFGPTRPTLAPFSALALVGTAAVVMFMAGAIALFAASSRALGRNWSLVARTRNDHELIRSGPYAHVRHPIYLGMLLFLFGLAAALGHWLALIVAVPLFLYGTLIRTKIEDRLLEETFGESFRSYRGSTPALVPRIL